MGCLTVEVSDLRAGKLIVGARAPDFDCSLEEVIENS